jgi:hypothetical protein
MKNDEQVQKSSAGPQSARGGMCASILHLFLTVAGLSQQAEHIGQECVKLLYWLCARGPRAALLLCMCSKPNACELCRAGRRKRETQEYGHMELPGQECVKLLYWLCARGPRASVCCHICQLSHPAAPYHSPLPSGALNALLLCMCSKPNACELCRAGRRKSGDVYIVDYKKQHQQGVLAERSKALA